MKKVVLFLLAILCCNCLFAQFKIQRLLRTKDCIQGYLYVNSDKIGYTLELPWNENAEDVSAILGGTYSGKIGENEELGWIIRLTGVPGRTGVLIHIGNYPWNSKGCILLGTGIDVDNCKVLKSDDAMKILKSNVTFQKLINEDITFEFTTIPECTNCNKGNLFTDSRDGKTYKTVKIGSQTWMAENLNYSTSNSWCYDNNNSNCNTYGRLYTWEAAKIACPAGWHLPTDNEWTKLIDFLGGQNGAGGKMKQSGTTNWWEPNNNATNSSGFTVLPGGGRNYGGNFGNMGFGALFWSSTEVGTDGAWSRDLGYDYAAVGTSYDGKNYGFSVRCLQD
jgi:uncharacterized protein (TIGR02145 family)